MRQNGQGILAVESLFVAEPVTWAVSSSSFSLFFLDGILTLDDGKSGFDIVVWIECKVRQQPNVDMVCWCPLICFEDDIENKRS